MIYVLNAQDFSSPPPTPRRSPNLHFHQFVSHLKIIIEQEAGGRTYRRQIFMPSQESSLASLSRNHPSLTAYVRKLLPFNSLGE